MLRLSVMGAVVGACVGFGSFACAQDVAAPSSEPAHPAVEAPVAPPTPQPEVAASAAAAPAVPPAVVKAGSYIQIEIAEGLSSQNRVHGDKYALKLAAPIMLNGKVVVPAGTPGVGQVVSASKAGMIGKPGELLLAARYLEYQGAQIPLRGMKLGGVGADNTDVAFVASMVFIGAALLFPGGEIRVPEGTKAAAKLGVDLTADGVAVAPVPKPTPVTAPLADAVVPTGEVSK
jgi:hypothetical protein